MSEHTINCAHCKGTHQTAEGVRQCHQGREIDVCGHLYYTGEWTEDGERVVAECGTDAWWDERGSDCANGHFNASMETQYAEGWRYVDDEDEARQMRSLGLDAVAMNGGSI